ncbi:MAG: O-antigen ligase family protein [Acidimicrobiia bacterium]|nr:O-antigen ligase family protein [Acidimicrobiia bacterium]
MTDTVSPPRPVVRRRDTGIPVVVAQIGGALLALAVLTGLGQRTTVVVLGTLAVVGLVLAATGRFQTFLLTLIVVRASLDVSDQTVGDASLMKPASLVALMMIGVSSVWLWLNRHQRPARRITSVTVGLVAFTIVAALSVLRLDEPQIVAGDVLALVAGTLMFLCVERLFDLGMPVRRLVTALVAAAVVPLLLPLVGPLVGVETTHLKEGEIALRSTFVLSNNFAQFLVPIILLAIAVGHRMRGGRRWLLYGVALLGSIELVLTLTRGAWIGLAIGVVTVGLVENRRIIVGGLLIAVVAFVAVPNVRERIANVTPGPDAPRQESSLQWRLDHWAEIIPWNEDNQLTGIGFGMVRQLDENLKAPHNDYVKAYVETGWLGLIAFLTLIVGFVRAAWISRRRVRSGWQGGLANGVFAYAIAYVVISASENLISGIALLWYAMPLIALANWTATHAPRSETALTVVPSDDPVSAWE